MTTNNNGIKVVPTDVNDIPSSNFTPKGISLPRFNFKKIWKIFEILGRFFAGAIILFVLADLCPALREEIPSFYRLVDLTIDIIEWIYDLFWKIVT